MCFPHPQTIDWCCAALDIAGVLMNEMIYFADVLKQSEGLSYLCHHKISNWGKPFLSPYISFLTATQATQTHVQNIRYSSTINLAFQDVLGLSHEPVNSSLSFRAPLFLPLWEGCLICVLLAAMITVDNLFQASMLAFIHTSRKKEEAGWEERSAAH